MQAPHSPLRDGHSPMYGAHGPQSEFHSHDPQSHEHIHSTKGVRTAKEIIGIATMLRSLGASIDGVDVPRICIIGNQSAGKSSLVEAISGIPAPRDAGTCTRCPMEFRLSSASEGTPWSCQVSIRWEYDSNGRRSNNVREEPFGEALADREDVDEVLRAAQRAVLDGQGAEQFAEGRNMNEVMPMPMPSISQRGSIIGQPPRGQYRAMQSTPFSRNIVCVDVTGPDLADLAFVDLPGIVQNAEPEIVKLVEDLVVDYISGNSVILLTIPMSDDIQNQKAVRLAKQVDPHGLRTIGVLTKPDTLSRGASRMREMWLDVLEGRDHQLKHGYYCSRQPNDDERREGITQAEARSAEIEFFETTAPWSTSKAKNRQGTSNLIKAVSDLLPAMIKEFLPRLTDGVASQYALCTDELGTLPPVTTVEAMPFVLNNVTKFCSELERHVVGSAVYNKLVQGNNEAYRQLENAVRATEPTFVPMERGGGRPAGRAPTPTPQQQPPPSRRSSTISTGAANPANAPATPAPAPNEEVNRTRDRPAGRPERRRVQQMYIEDVRERINESITRELPNNIPYEMKCILMEDFKDEWTQFAHTCRENVHGRMEATLKELIEKHFSKYTYLKTVITPIITAHLQAHNEKAASHVRTILKMEFARPFTRNEREYIRERNRLNAQYRSERRQAAASRGPLQMVGNVAGIAGAAIGAAGNVGLVGAAHAEAVQTALAALARIGKHVSEEDLAQLDSEGITDELTIMAEVGAYFQIAHKRFIDYVPLSIDQHLLYEFSETLQSVLFEKLGLSGANAVARCHAYIAEDPSIVQRRGDLSTRKGKLEKIRKMLFDFFL